MFLAYVNITKSMSKVHEYRGNETLIMLDTDHRQKITGDIHFVNYTHLSTAGLSTPSRYFSVNFLKGFERPILAFKAYLHLLSALTLDIALRLEKDKFSLYGYERSQKRQLVYSRLPSLQQHNLKYNVSQILIYYKCITFSLYKL